MSDKADNTPNPPTESKNSLVGKLSTRAFRRQQSGPPTPFETQIRWIRRILNVILLLSLALVVTLCFITIEDRYTAEGVVRPGQYLRLYASTDLEQREKPLVTEGEKVQKDQVLMRFWLPELDYKILETRELLETSQAELVRQKAQTTSLRIMPLPKELWEINEQLATSKFHRDYCKNQLNRLEELSKSGDVSDQDVDKARLEYEQANIEHERLQQRIDKIDAGYTETLIKEAQAEEKQIETRIANVQTRLKSLESERERLSVLRAPDEGIILTLPHKHVIGIIQAGQELAYMAIGDTRVVQIFGNQKNFDKVKVDQVVRYKSQVYDPFKFGYAEGRVLEISQIRNPPTLSETDDYADRYYSIFATIEKQPKELTLDSNVTAQIILRKDRLLKVLFGRD